MMIGDFVILFWRDITGGYRLYNQWLNIDKVYEMTYYVESGAGDLSQ